MSRARSIVAGLWVVAVCAAVGLDSCSKNDSLVLLDLRTSGPLGAPVARLRLSAKGWPTRTLSGDIGPAGFQVGYYGPGNGGAVSVTVEALDAVDCVLGSGSGTVARLAAGATSDPTPVFVRPLPANDCVPDAGTTDDGGDDGGGEDAGADASADGGTDASDDTAADANDDSAPDASNDSAPDAGSDVGADSAADAMDDAATTDATTDAGPDASSPDGA